MTKQRKSFIELKSYLRSRSRFRMAHVYKPAMLLEIIRRGGRASRAEIAEAFMLRDDAQLKYYKTGIVKQMPGDRLVKADLLTKKGEHYCLTDTISNLSTTELSEIEEILEQRITDYLGIRNPFGDKNLDAVPGSLRFRVIKESGNRCELCGVSSKDVQIDVDHIIPRSKGGGNHRDNLQALCRACNSQKYNRDTTNFQKIHQSYSDRDSECLFCNPETVEFVIPSESDLAYAARDNFAVTKGHTLIIPKRHVQDYFALYQSERTAMERLLLQQREVLMKNHPDITGWNVGVNCGESAGQSIFHVHIHLIPRRNGDVENPRGGVRGVVPGKQNY